MLHWLVPAAACQQQWAPHWVAARVLAVVCEPVAACAAASEASLPAARGSHHVGQPGLIDCGSPAAATGPACVAAAAAAAAVHDQPVSPETDLMTLSAVLRPAASAGTSQDLVGGRMLSAGPQSEIETRTSAAHQPDARRTAAALKAVGVRLFGALQTGLTGPSAAAPQADVHSHADDLLLYHTFELGLCEGPATLLHWTAQAQNPC